MNIYGLTLPQLEQYLLTIGEKPSKAPLLFHALYQQDITDFAQLTALNARLRQHLACDLALTLPVIIEHQTCDDTDKLLLQLDDASLIEAVVMRQKYGASLCLSTQVGCSMGCAFCQSGRFKRTRSLETWELTAQVIAIQRTLGVRVSNIVLMGIGEPFDNYDHVMDFLAIVGHPKGLALGRRRLCVSTCGIAPRIRDYGSHSAAGLLAVSLHAPNDALRQKLMPIGRRYPLHELMAAIDDYIRLTGKRVMLEYTLLADVNDSASLAHELADLIGPLNCHVNLIPYNETQNLGFAKSNPQRIRAFYDVLKKRGVIVTLRREFGSALHAACGQLRADYQKRQ